MKVENLGRPRPETPSGGDSNLSPDVSPILLLESHSPPGRHAELSSGPIPTEVSVFDPTGSLRVGSL